MGGMQQQSHPQQQQQQYQPASMLPPQEAPLIRSYDISPTSALTSPSNTTIYIGNLLPSVTQADLIPLFQSFGYIIEIRMQPDRGFAFVKLDSHENACLAIVNLQGRDLGGRGMKCSWGKDRDTQGGGGGQYQVRSRVSPFGATLTRAATRVPAAAAATTVRTATAAGSSGRGSRSGVAGAVRRTIRSLVRVPHPDGNVLTLPQHAAAADAHTPATGPSLVVTLTSGLIALSRPSSSTLSLCIFPSVT